MANFPRSGTFLEIIDRIRAHNRLTYGIATPGNSWCGTDTIEPKAAARIFEEWLVPHVNSGVLRIERGWDVDTVETKEGRVTGVSFMPSVLAKGDPDKSLAIRAKLTIDSSDPRRRHPAERGGLHGRTRLRSRFGEPGAPGHSTSSANRK